MGFKDEFKREMRNIIKDVEKEVAKTWRVDYQGHSIEIINKIKEEQLIIDGVTVATNKRKYILSHIIPYSTLKGTIEQKDGSKHKVVVKLGGFVKLNCIVKVGTETIFHASQKLTLLPWEHKGKIAPYIRQQVQVHNKIVDESLPDEKYLYDDNQPRLAAGFSDRFASDIPTPFFAKKLVRLFGEQITQPSDKTRKAIYEEIIFDNIASYRTELIDRLKQVHFDEARMQEEALWLLEHAAHREVVKFAITVLGCTNCEKYKELLFTIGLHEEFTSYVIFALKNGTSNANAQIWKLAKSVHGWGKIAAVEQIEATTPEIKQWLLTKGCENRINVENLANLCAVKGELDIALFEETISKELYEGASLIIGALLERSHQGIDEYPYGSQVLTRFVYHARTHCRTLDDFYRLMRISEFLNGDEEDWEERYNNGWKQYERASIQEMLKPFIDDPRWIRLAQEALQQDYDYKAVEITHFYSVDVTADLFNLLEKYPTKSELYIAIMETNNLLYITDLCKFAETHLSLSHLSNEEQDCLYYIVQDLHEYVGVGLPLIQAALKADHVSLQFQALNVLDDWTPAIWKQPAILESIKVIAMTSQDKEDRQLAKQLLTISKLPSETE